ncbi:MAG: acetate--CoA ligase family protein [Candidatus Jordarchaeum sp.]|uniref:acetate--CoA ligase family protein n=1 Tax=Candidatus Jordarchaeum sp. TaxID=2823881 RepID=UPI00404A8236
MSNGEEFRDLSPIFEPKSVALIGASNNPLKWGWVILSNILSHGYIGSVYPINPKEDNILGLKTYKTIFEISEEIDLAIVVRPAESVPQHIEECVEKEVKSAIVLAGGFRETGKEGEVLEKEVVEIAHKGKLLIVGPNTMGVYSAPASLLAIMSPISVVKGEVSLISMSGNIGVNLLSMGSTENVGFNKFVSIGNQADITLEEYLKFFGDDPETKIILIYIEGLRQGKKFMEVAEKITEKKPVIVLKAGRSTAGAKAARSHSGALAGSNMIYDAVFKQSGVIKVSTINGMLELAKAFIHLPLPKGKRVGIVSWGGGYGVVAADACEEAGLDIPNIQEKTIQELDNILPPYWNRGNPVDLVGTLDRSIQPKSLETIVKDENIDAIIASGFLIGGSGIKFASPDTLKKGVTITERGVTIDEKGISMEVLAQKWMRSSDEQNMNKINELVEKYQKPIIAVTLTSDTKAIPKAWEKNTVVYPTLEVAAEVLAKMYEYKQYLEKKKNNKDSVI